MPVGFQTTIDENGDTLSYPAGDITAGLVIKNVKAYFAGTKMLLIPGLTG